MMGDWKEISTAPKDRVIFVCTRGMTTPWVVEWREGKSKQGWHAAYGYIWFNPEFWCDLPKCP